MLSDLGLPYKHQQGGKESVLEMAEEQNLDSLTLSRCLKNKNKNRIAQSSGQKPAYFPTEIAPHLLQTYLTASKTCHEPPEQSLLLKMKAITFLVI